MAEQTTSTVEGATVRIKLVRSPIGYERSQRDTVRSLGLRRMHQVVEQHDTPQLRGMMKKVRHMIQVVDASGAPVVEA